MSRRRLADIDDPCMIFIGSLNTANDLDWLKANNIKVILNVCNNVEAKFYDGIVYTKWGLDDPLETLAPRNHVAYATTLMACAVEHAENLGGNFLIHCAAGNNRSSLVAAKWLERYKGWDFGDAVEVAQVKDQKPWMMNQGYRW